MVAVAVEGLDLALLEADDGLSPPSSCPDGGPSGSGEPASVKKIAQAGFVRLMSRWNLWCPTGVKNIISREAREVQRSFSMESKS